MSRSPLLPVLKTACFFLSLLICAQRGASQTQTEAQFIASVNASITSLTGTLGTPTHPVIFSGNLVYAHGSAIPFAPMDILMDYVDGLKAAGAHRVDINPQTTSLSDPAVAAKYDAVVRRVRQLGLRLAINPEFEPGELGAQVTFQDFQKAALQAYPAMAARFHPDYFVIIHEPTTMAGRMGILTTVQEWHNFIVAVAPLIKAASPHTRLGAGGYQGTTTDALSAQEAQFFQDFVTIPALDFMTMDIYDGNSFPQYTQWAQMAHAAGKGVYIEETWAPTFLPNPLPADAISPLGYLTKPLDQLAIVGPANQDFEDLDANWLHAMVLFASANNMEAVTPFTTQAFFAYGTAGSDRITLGGYASLVTDAIARGRLTKAAQTYVSDSKKFGIKLATSLSSASYATLPSVFNPACGTPDNPCNADSSVAPDALISAFGVDLATKTATATSSDFPTKLGDTTMTLVDSSNTSYAVQMYSVSPGQVNYMVPTKAQPGPAVTTVTSGDGTVTTGIVLVAPVTPGIYTANANGKGTAAAVAVIVHANGTQSTQLTFTCSGAGDCVAKPISLSASDKLFIELYATGVRHLSSKSAISAEVNGQNAPVEYAGKQGAFSGLDQINVEIPQSLTDGGPLNIQLTVVDNADNITTISNYVTVTVQ